MRGAFGPIGAGFGSTIVASESDAGVREIVVRKGGSFDWATNGSRLVKRRNGKKALPRERIMEHPGAFEHYMRDQAG
jgi:hypothetical protein